MSQYRVEVARRAVVVIARLQRKEQLRIRAAIDLLADEPRPPGCVALAGEDSVYGVRVGDCRILYEVSDRRLVIQVVRVRGSSGHRLTQPSVDPTFEYETGDDLCSPAERGSSATGAAALLSTASDPT